MFTSALVLVLAVAASARKCTDITVPVTLTSQNAHFDLNPLSSKVAVTDIFLRMSQPSSTLSQDLQKGMKEVHGSYNLAATYCRPDKGHGKDLQILTHGVGFDRKYWDLPFNNYNYSYAAYAVDEEGYSTFAWDRLGIADSSRGDPVNEIQSFLEIAALKEITTRLRKGTLKGVDAHFDKVSHIGHSFGSVMTYALANENPELTDAIILTGFSQDSTYMPYFALGGNFAPVNLISGFWKRYSIGYVAPDTAIGMHINFFAPDGFDPKMREYAYKNGHPAAIGELLTLGPPASVVSAYTGPVLIITGERDVPFCGGNCYTPSSLDKDAESIPAASHIMFPKASQFNATIVPGAGHGLNMEYSHPFTYSTILNFLAQNI